ncbi:MAG: beta-galactosidase [Tepidisphaerales bacterium]
MPKLPILTLAILATGISASALTVRVDPGNGAPRLVVNGQPVRSRMFWGAPGSSPIPISPQWNQSTFDFVASASATNGTMHFRFGPTPGEVYLDDIHVVDLDTSKDLIPLCDFEAGQDSFKRDWTFWPPDAKNTVGTVRVSPGAGRANSAGLQVTLKAPPDGHWPDFHVYHHGNLNVTAGHRYRVTFYARSEPARPLTVAFYRPGPEYLHIGGTQNAFAAQIKLAAGAGVNFVSFPVQLPWPEPGKPADWAASDAQCETVLRANPNALLLPRIGIGAPAWWRKAHPDDQMQWEDGRRDDAVVASPQYRRDAAERLAALVAHLEEKFGDYVAGYHPTGQNTGEWFYVDTWGRLLNGYAPADLAAWRLWLKSRYGNDAALRLAWNDTAITCDSAAIPTAAARHAAPAGIFRDPATERPLTDWAEFQQQAMADCVCDLARAVRTASKGQKLVVFFYGYVFEFGAIQNGPSTSGHYALRRALDCPDIDVLCSPISYFDRGLGQSAPSMTAAESVALAGKLWLNEDDTHTYLASEPFPGSDKHVTTIEDSNAQLIRNIAQESMRNFGTWWMDLGSSGWFNDPAMWEQMKRLRALDEPLLQQPTPFRPEIAAVIDERSMLQVAAGGQVVTVPVIYEARLALGRTGAPYGQYLLDDVLAGRVHAKVYVLLNAWRLSPADREKLLLATRGATRIWCYAPGYFDDDRTSLPAMRQLTGFELAASKSKAWATPSPAGQKLGLQRPFGVQKSLQPLFAAANVTADETLATYPDGTAAIAMRRVADGTSIFVGAPGLTSELLRLAARAAGAHLFTHVDCNVYATGRFLAVHASQDGPLQIDLARPGEIIDLLTGAKLGSGPKITLPLKRGETRVLSAQ